MKKAKYDGFTIIEMLIVMAVLIIFFLAIGSLLSTMIRTSNTVSSRILIREEGEYLAEVFRRYIRNSSIDHVVLYHREAPSISFDDSFQVNGIGGNPSLYNEETLSADHFATEIHFRPSAERANRVVCMGLFFHENRGYIVRSMTRFEGSLRGSYTPNECFPPGASGQDFRKNFAILNSDLIYIDGLEIRRDITTTNTYYSIDIDMSPRWGVGGLSNYRTREGSPTYRKSFVIQTRLLFHW